ncbi:sodium- and chloride-dependent glycine transporter 1-like [Gigantopelta aegis]|uniref:sodium- and chloride-dependent glycine transporter 1-like n=1 Tax=Gigantopelta aegis TaxID=1735272 RepID=UPI001B88D562|nr:sodium- and chloride-dependent glycine transporter 1-like [Gigantopelta aegis]
MAAPNQHGLYPTVPHSGRDMDISNGNADGINEAQVDLLRGTEKYQGNAQPSDKPGKWGVAWYKQQEYPENNLEQENPNEQLVQDVSSTAVLTPLDDDLVGNIEDPGDRGNWTGRFDFLMSLLGYSVGLGNVWRFPYLCYKNGGGAFLFPFIIMLFLIGMPMMFMELAFGQFAALGPAAIFERICPLFYGLGYGMIAVSALVSLYYTVIIAWAILYMFTSFTSELPWQRCHKPWATKNCYSYQDADECQSVNGSFYFKTVCYNASMVVENNMTAITHSQVDRHAPAQDFFERHILTITEGIHEIGTVKWQIALCLLFAWSLTFLALSRGVKSVGKVVYFTALFPYFVLTILFFRGVTLPGAINGIIFYVTPDFKKLATAQTWVDAAVQIFFALSPAWGGLITLSSYNKFHNNCFKDSLIVSIGNICTSIFAGFVIFSIVGYLAYELDMPVDKVVEQGPGLAFIVFPDVVTRLPIPPIWSFLFFFMLITLGMGSEFALLETVMTAIQDTYPPFRQKKTWVVLVVSILGFFGGLVICTEGGMYVLQLMDTYAASWSVFFMAILECVIIGWIYGADRFLNDIEQMIGVRGRHWKNFFKAFWKYLTPGTLLFLLFFNWIEYKPMSYAGRKYPFWANIIGWVMAFIPIIAILSMSALKLRQAPSGLSLIEKIRHMLKPSASWGPAHKIPKFDITDVDNGKVDARTITNPGFNGNGPFETKI